MARVSLATLASARPVPPLPGVTGAVDTRAYFDRAGDPLHLHLHSLAPGGELQLAAADRDRLLYVWEGDLAAGERPLPRRSSAVIESGAALEVTAGEIGALLLCFAARDPGGNQGGQVHLADFRDIARFVDADGTHGGLHFNAECPTCTVWLHEISLTGTNDDDAAAMAERSIHAYGDDEILFVTEGTLRLGNRHCGPGTALATAAGTFHGFAAGHEGVSFIAFRAALPGSLRMKSGAVIDEAAAWRSRTGADPR